MDSLLTYSSNIDALVLYRAHDKQSLCLVVRRIGDTQLVRK